MTRSIGTTTSFYQSGMRSDIMKKCFVCKMELTLTNQCPCDLDDCGKTHVEFIFNEDDSAHAACVWRAAKTMMTATELINDNH